MYRLGADLLLSCIDAYKSDYSDEREDLATDFRQFPTDISVAFLAFCRFLKLIKGLITNSAG